MAPSLQQDHHETNGAKPHVIIIGAGPSGCLLALLLARQGATVAIYDLRDDPQAEPIPTSPKSTVRSINLALSTRGLTALQAVGLSDVVRAAGIAMYARCVHLPHRAALQLHAYGQPGEHLLSVSRVALVAALVDQCRQHTDIRLHFGYKCVAVDLQRPSVTVVPTAPAGTQSEQLAFLVVGADGSFSRVRAAMARQPGFDFAQHYIPCCYKELALSAPRNDHDFPLNALHIWPHADAMLIALPNATDGERASFTATLFMARTQFDALRSAMDVRAFFHKCFPAALPFMPDVEVDFMDNPTPALLTVRCRPYHVGAAVLIGDAAHAIVPFYGQGCNAALEDCTLLSALIEQYGWGDVTGALTAYTEGRKLHADTIADLAIDHYHDMSSRSASPYFVLKRRVEILFNRLFPRLFLPLYSMVSFSNIPYADAVARSKRQDRVVGIAIGMGAALTVASFSAAVLMATSRCRLCAPQSPIYSK